MALAFVNSKIPAAAARLPKRLDSLLRGTSRSIYLTLHVAPRPIRRQLMLGYLFCRAADTIADTRALPPERRIEMLELYRAQFERGAAAGDLRAIREAVEEPGAGGPPVPGFTPEEGALLRQLEACFQVYQESSPGDRELFDRLLTTLTRGMEMDLRSFPPEESGRAAALETEADLDRYCYHVAGCVGEFWTDLQAAHLPQLAGLDHGRMRALAVRFGKGLQMTNVLRDLPRDLRIGRCYLPLSMLRPAGIAPEELHRTVAEGAVTQGAVTQGIGAQGAGDREELARRLDPILQSLLDLTIEHYRAGWEYTLALPRRLPRLRLACAWPLLIGLATLKMLRQGTVDLLSGRGLKIPRRRIYRILAASAVRCFSDPALNRYYQKLESQAQRS